MLENFNEIVSYFIEVNSKIFKGCIIKITYKGNGTVSLEIIKNDTTIYQNSSKKDFEEFKTDCYLEVATKEAQKDYETYNRSVMVNNGIPYLKFENSLLGNICIFYCPEDYQLKLDTIKEIINPTDLLEIEHLLKPNYLIGIVNTGNNLYISKNMFYVNIKDKLINMYRFAVKTALEKIESFTPNRE